MLVLDESLGKIGTPWGGADKGRMSLVGLKGEKGKEI